MDLDFADRFADRWVAAWNAHDLDLILEHYTEDVVFSSPFIGRVLGTDANEVRGKSALRDYWSKGLELSPDLHFSVEGVKVSVDTIVIDFRNEVGRPSAEVLTFRGDLVCRGLGAHGRG
jgi:hypothetical protein